MKIVIAVMAAIIGLMCYQIHNLQESTARNPPVYVIDWTGIMQHDWHGQDTLAIAAANSVIDKLKASGALVLDYGAVISAPDVTHVGVEQIQYLVQQAQTNPNSNPNQTEQQPANSAPANTNRSN